jgi:hypothetical protein
VNSVLKHMGTAILRKGNANQQRAEATDETPLLRRDAFTEREVFQVAEVRRGASKTLVFFSTGRRRAQDFRPRWETGSKTQKLQVCSTNLSHRRGAVGACGFSLGSTERKNWLSFSRKQHQTKPLEFLVCYSGTRRSKVQILTPRRVFFFTSVDLPSLYVLAFWAVFLADRGVLASPWKPLSGSQARGPRVSRIYKKLLFS